MVFDRFRQRLSWDGTHGTPPSGNGASSLHLQWILDAPGPAHDWVAAEAVLEVVEAPVVAALSFWALQASFNDRGRHAGAGHLGLQWHSGHPGSTAVNWGGYRAAGGELDGSPSPLPSATGNVNTRDFAWAPGTAYRLRIGRADADPGATEGAGRASSSPPPGLVAWRGGVTDLDSGETIVVRDLWAAGSTLDGPLVWSEVFARCDDPSASVHWSGMRLIDGAGLSVPAPRVRVNYQTLGDGGCATTDSSPDGRGIVQATGTHRRTPQGAVIEVPPS